MSNDLGDILRPRQITEKYGWGHSRTSAILSAMRKDKKYHRYGTGQFIFEKGVVQFLADHPDFKESDVYPKKVKRESSN